jgi:DNA-binding CsgD family transcriptional regulator
VYENLSAPRRRHLHGRAAAALRTREPVPLGRLAHHLKHAGRQPEWADVAERAAGQAIALANDEEATRLLEDVLRHGSVEGEQRHRMLLMLGWAAQRTLHAGRTTDLLSAALEQDLPRPVRGELQFVLAQALNQTGEDQTRQRALFVGAVGDLEHRPDLRAWSMVALGIPTTPGIAEAEHLRWLDRCLELAGRIGDPVLEAFLLGKAAGAWLQLGHPSWRTAVGRLRDLTRAGPRHRREVNAYYSVGLEAAFTGHLDIAETMLSEGLGAQREPEDRKQEVLLRSGLALLRYATGPWAGLRAEVDVLLDELAEYPRNRLDVEVVAGCLALATGDLDQATSRLESVVEQAGRIAAHQVLPLAAGSLARAALADGDAGGAVAAIRNLVAVLDAKQLWACAGWGLPAAVEALATAGEPDEAQRLIDHCTAKLRDRDAPLAAAGLRHAQGLLDAAAGRLQASAAGLVTAAAAYQDLRCRYLQAQALEAAAAAWFRGGDAGAEACVRSAIGAYRELGAGWDEARAERLARRHGVQPAARHGGGRRSYGSQLSPRERKVAELVATGRTNREIAAYLFLSPHTVDKHLRSAMRKLRVRSRSALAAQLSPAESKTGELTP